MRSPALLCSSYSGLLGAASVLFRDRSSSRRQDLAPDSSVALAGEFHAQGVCPSTQPTYSAGHQSPSRRYPIIASWKLKAAACRQRAGKAWMLRTVSQTELYALTLQLMRQYRVQDS